jgi:hypothetical protein
MLAFVDLIHALRTRGRKVPNSCIHPGGVFASRGENLREMNLFRGACIHAFGSSLSPDFSCALLLMVLSSFASPCLRGARLFSLKWSFLGLCFAFDHLFELFSRFFSFFVFSELVTCVCVVNALINREIEDQSVRGPVDGRS